MSSTLYAPMFRILHMALSDRVKKVIDDDGISQARLAKDAGCTRSAVNQWLSKNSQTMDYVYAVQIERVRGWRKEWLMNGELPEKVGVIQEQSRLDPDERREWLRLAGRLTSTQRIDLRDRILALISANEEIVKELGPATATSVDAKVNGTLGAFLGNDPQKGRVRYEGLVATEPQPGGAGQSPKEKQTPAQRHPKSRKRRRAVP